MRLNSNKTQKNIQRELNKLQFVQDGIDASSYRVMGIDEADKWGKKRYGLWYRYLKVSKNQYNKINGSYPLYGLRNYHGNGYVDINRGLRNPEASRNIDYVQTNVGNLLRDAVLAPLLGEKVILYRLVDYNFLETYLNAFANDKVKEWCWKKFYFEEGFISTCMNKEFLLSDDKFNGRDVLLEMYVDENASGYYVGPLELEYVLLPKKRLRIFEKPIFDISIKKLIVKVEVLDILTYEHISVNELVDLERENNDMTIWD